MTFTATIERVALCAQFCDEVPDESLLELARQNIGLMSLLRLLAALEFADKNWHTESASCCLCCDGSEPYHDDDCQMGQAMRAYRRIPED